MATPLEILDTAVKIGLGALLAAASALVLAAKQHRSDLQKERMRRRHELMEAVAQDIAAFTHITLKYWARIITWLNYRDSGEDMQPERMSQLESLRDDLFNAFERMTASEGKLLLLGETKAQELLREYGELVGRFRSYASTENHGMDRQELDKARRDILAGRNRFFTALSDAYRAGDTT